MSKKKWKTYSKPLKNKLKKLNYYKMNNNNYNNRKTQTSVHKPVLAKALTILIS